MPDSLPERERLPVSRDDMAAIATLAVAHAKAQGASDADAEVSASVGQSVTVRLGEVETVEYNRDKGLGVTVYFGAKRGNASTSDLSAEAVRRTVEAACAIARHTAEDSAAGLPDAARLFRGEPPDLALDFPWSPPVEESIEIARRMESAALAVDERIDNSEGATVSSYGSDFIFANSLGFLNGYPTTRASLSCGVLASTGRGMQRDYWYDVNRDRSRLADPEAIGRIAGERVVRRLDARKVATCDAPVLFEANVAGSLIGHFVNAASGSSLYRKSSFLLDSLGKPIFAPGITLTEDPFIPGGLASGAFDAEGVATAARAVVERGVLMGYFLGSYSARKLGMETTGNAGGNHNLVLADDGLDFDALVKRMRRGLVVTELMGQGVNSVTGDYSRGAAGFWVEDGEIRFPVEEVTIAGNLKDVFRSIVAVGNDVLVRGSKRTGSILVESLTIAGN
jgi:PmbA protein